MSNNNTVEVRDLREQDWLWTSKALLFHTAITGNSYKVYCGLASYADNQSQAAFPSIETLAKRLHMGRSTVIRSLAHLEASGFIQIEKKDGEHNIYYLLKIADGLQKKAKPKAEAQVADEDRDWVKKILEWAEKKRGSKYVVYNKQIGALGLMKKAGYKPREICECYVLMEKSEFWKSKGFDFTNVANEIPKKINIIRNSHGAKVFDHLVAKSA